MVQEVLRQRTKRARRQRILRAAKQAFCQHGFRLASMEEIARRAGLSVGTLYLYFKGKEELYVSLLIESMQRFADALEGIRAGDQPPAVKLRAVWDFFYAYRQQFPASYQALLRLHDPDLQEAVSAEVMADLKRRAAKNFSLAAAIVEEGMRQGVYRHRPPRQVVDLLWSLFIGMVHLMETRQHLGLQVGSLEALHRTAFQVFEEGLRLPPA